jgi:ADP-ribose pyrophosphatase
LSDEEARPGKLGSRRIYTGRVLNLDVDSVRFPDGNAGELEMIRHPGASAVIPVLSPRGTADPEILLIRQYRYAAEGVIWEIPAGRLDQGEAPETCARRELLEETGMEAERLEKLTTIYTTPGFTDERIHLFAAYGVREAAAGHSREADEFVELAPLTLSRVLGLIRDGELTDAKTMCAVLFYAGLRTGM